MTLSIDGVVYIRMYFEVCHLATRNGVEGGGFSPGGTLVKLLCHLYLDVSNKVPDSAIGISAPGICTVKSVLRVERTHVEVGNEQKHG